MNLNFSQTAAVESRKKEILVLAGAGTGKTRVIIQRIERLIQSGVPAGKIIATTFTNKAAKEMKERLAMTIGDAGYAVICGTFHRISSYFLKLYGSEIGLDVNFQVLTEDDQSRLIKSICKSLGEPTKHPRKIAEQISTHKESAKKRENDPFFKKLFEIYSNELINLKFLDYSDLIQSAIFLFENKKEIINPCVEHLLVDEYQDINESQYKWIKLLGENKNILCVGDEDQSIYAFRGANIKYIQKFEEDFPNAEIIKLEENYRSCPEILKSATTLIGKNPRKFEKKLLAAGNVVGSIRVSRAFNEFEEASLVAKLISQWKAKDEQYKIGVLVRTNLQIPYLEHALIEAKIAYELASGRKFFAQKVIQDLVAYLRVILFEHDYFAFSRILNTPKRGIGEAKLEAIISAIKSLECDCQSALASLLPQLPRATSEKCKIFLMQLQEWRKLFKDGIALDLLLEKIIKDTKYDEQEDYKETQKESVATLKNQLKEEKSLQDFLSNLQFVAQDNGADVQLMTMHAAKGLEFDVVITPGWEENLFPSPLSRTTEEMQEERRLAYVTITRAKIGLEITNTCSRRINGRYSSQMPSRFIFDL
jgi:DNA helicase-2/ATP-dependent DNA helicase PcrA